AVLGGVAVGGLLIGDDGHEALLRVLLFDEIFTGFTLHATAEEDGEVGGQAIDLEGVLGSEQLGAQTEGGTDETPRGRRLDEKLLAAAGAERYRGAREVLGRRARVID